jgi:glycosyltransferase involved in cell wall biosynthesis
VRIAIDATSVPHQRLGAGTYIYSLVQALAQVESDDRYFVFAKPETFAGCPELVGGPARTRFRLVPVRLPWRLARMAWEQMLLPWHLRRLRVDVLHSPHYTTTVVVGAWWRVVTFHDVTFFLLPERYPALRCAYFRAASRAGARLADLAIAVSRTVKADVERHLPIPPERVRVVPLAAAPSYRPLDDPPRMAAVRAKYSLPDRFVLNVGALEPGKNQATLLRAFARLKAQASSTRSEQALVIAGPPAWRYERLIHLADRLGLAGQVRFLGYVPAEDLPALYNLADLFVFPSLYEGFGLPPLEAMACGLPVVASTAPALREVLDGAALLVQPQDVAALTEAMDVALGDDPLRSRLREAGLQRAGLFSWERTARETAAVYHEAAANREA